jgi:hypothetical protein
MYKVIAGHVNSFFALAESEDKRLPKFVHDEFDAFLRCGIHAYGFIRMKCSGCDHERLVAFSCKKRGFCTSCGGRRMSESAAHLVDEVFPRVGIRQWVVSFPFPIRFLLARNPKLQSKVLGICLRAIKALLQSKVKRPGLKIQGGAVTLLQRFGGSLNLNLHKHMLVLEGGYYDTPDGPKFWWVDPPTDAEIKTLVETIAKRVIRSLQKRGHFQDGNEGIAEDGEPDALTELQAASVRSRVALGKRHGEWIRRIGSIGNRAATELTGPLCANISGFSLHAAVYCAPWERAKLEKLCRYVTRPAVAESRLKLLANDRVLLKLKKSYTDGTSHLVFSPIEFIEKLAALVPPPRAHLIRFHGTLAPHAKIRSLIVPKKPEPKVEPAPHANETEKPKPPSDPRRMAQGHLSLRSGVSWAKLLRRVFGMDMEKCPHCSGEMKIIAAIMESKAVEKILKHVGLPPKPPDVAPARYPVQQPLFSS